MSGDRPSTRSNPDSLTYDFTKDKVLDYCRGATALDRVLAQTTEPTDDPDVFYSPELTASHSEDTSSSEDSPKPLEPRLKKTFDWKRPLGKIGIHKNRSPPVAASHTPKSLGSASVPLIYSGLPSSITLRPGAKASCPPTTKIPTGSLITSAPAPVVVMPPPVSTPPTAIPSAPPLAGAASSATTGTSGHSTSSVAGAAAPVPRMAVATIPMLPGNDCYDGHGHVEDFLHRFEAIAKVHGWDPDSKAYYFPLCLTGTCRNWFRTFLAEYRRRVNDPAAEPPFAEMKKNFSEVFASKITEDELEQRLRNRKRAAGETIYDYYYSIMRLCDRLRGIDDEKRIKYLLKGLPRSLATNLFLQKPATPGDLLDLLESHEQFEYILGAPRSLHTLDFIPEDSPLPRNPDQVTKSMKHLQSTMDKLANKVEQLSLAPINSSSQTRRGIIKSVNNNQPDRTADGRFYCWICKREGHTRSHCPRKQVSFRGQGGQRGAGTNPFQRQNRSSAGDTPIQAYPAAPRFGYQGNESSRQ